VPSPVGTWGHKERGGRNELPPEVGDDKGRNLIIRDSVFFVVYGLKKSKGERGFVEDILTRKRRRGAGSLVWAGKMKRQKKGRSKEHLFLGAC